VRRFADHLAERCGAGEAQSEEGPVVVWGAGADRDRLQQLTEDADGQVDVAGWAPSVEGSRIRDTSLVVLWADGCVAPAPTDFAVVAFVTAFNEADVIASAIDRLAAEGVGAYLIDNWSTDGTWEIAQRRFGRGLIGAERFPAAGPLPTFEWRRLLGRVEELAVTTRADWVVHIDADERRASAWPGVPLRDALWRVDRRGFNAVDHTVLTFPPVDDGFGPGSDPEHHFRLFEFGRNVGHFVQIKAWKRTRERVDLASTGGHEAAFEGRRVFPYNFLSKHYPVRSQAHGERKIFLERRSRWSAGERAAGWHVQYDHIQAGHSFLRDPASLDLYEEDDFARRYLVERLSRVGVPPPLYPVHG
jgi:hypothetical protein